MQLHDAIRQEEKRGGRQGGAFVLLLVADPESVAFVRSRACTRMIS